MFWSQERLRWEQRLLRQALCTDATADAQSVPASSASDGDGRAGRGGIGRSDVQPLRAGGLIGEIVDLLVDVLSILNDIKYIFFTGLFHHIFIVYGCLSWFSYLVLGTPDISDLMQIRAIVWETGTYLQNLQAESVVRSKFNTESQVGSLVSDRRGGMCHHCHPTGVSDAAGSDAEWDLVEFFAQMQFLCRATPRCR